MSQFEVSVPFAGYFHAMVEADTEDDAWEKLQDGLQRLTIEGDESMGIDVGEWEVLREICRGNVLYAPQNEWTCDRVDDDD